MLPPNSLHDPQSDSGDEDSDEFERMRLWADHTDWDVFGEAPDVNQDVQWAMQLLRDGKISKAHRYTAQPQSAEMDSKLPVLGDATGERSSTSVNKDVGDEVATTPTGHQGLISLSNHRFGEPEFLGAGAFGVVLRVMDESLGMHVSVKLLRPSRSNSIQLRQRFIAEAKATARLSHPGIVRIYETGQIGPLPYISTACADGGSLSEYLAQSKLTPRQSAWLLSQIADAVHHAHSNAVLHRDLKPSNILLAKASPNTTEQLGFVPLLTDFGLAKRIDAKAASLNLTSHGSVVGTLKYASPEQARGDIDEIDTTSDVFSLGIILYELLVGNVPFDSPNEHKVTQLLNNDFVPLLPRAANPNIPRDLEAIVLKCLAKTKKDRYQTAHELWLDLQRFLCGQPVQAQASTFLRRLQHAIRTHPVLATISTLTICINLAALFGLYSAWTREHAALIVKQAAHEQERIARDRERIAGDNERISKDREREVLVGIVSVFSELGDLLHARVPIQDEQLLTLLEKSIKHLDRHCRDNPGDEPMLHRLSVLKHYLAVTYQTVGRMNDGWRERLEVETILARLIELNPEKKAYRFQYFFTKRLIGERLINDRQFQLQYPNRIGLEELENAVQLIQQLIVEVPDNVDYQDALAATEITMATILSEKDPSRSNSMIDHAIDTSTRLWQENPSRPLLIKYAIQGLALKARLFAYRQKPQQARDAYQEAVKLFETAWRPHIEERWAVNEASNIYEAWAEILIANKEYDEALEALKQCDKIHDLYDEVYPIVAGTIARRMIDDTKRMKVYTATGDENMRLEVEKRMRSRVEASRDIPDAIDAFRQVDREVGLPASVSVLLNGEITQILSDAKAVSEK